MTARSFLVFGLLLAPRAATGQGGPPLVTDDPGTPGNRHWEVNVAFAFEKRGSERTFETPLLDANYGLGDRIQLKVEIPWIVRRHSGSTEDGLGNALLGVKWHFLDEKTAAVSIATYPQLEVNASRSSAGKGLVEKNIGLLFPLSFAKALGPVSANVEIGHAFRRGEKPRWIYGLALGHEFSEDLEIMAEIFGRASAQWSDVGSAWNLGARWKLGVHAILIFSAGTGIRSIANEPRTNFQSYAGVQTLF